MAEQRILLIGGVSLVKGRVKEAGLVMAEICDELEPLLDEIGFVNAAPFKTVSVIIRFGTKTDLVPDYDRIDKRHCELPVAVEMELPALQILSRELLKTKFIKATIDVLVDVGNKYKLPVDHLLKIQARAMKPVL